MRGATLPFPACLYDEELKKYRNNFALSQTGFRDFARQTDNLSPKNISLQQEHQALHHNGNAFSVSVFVGLGMYWCRVHPHHTRLGNAFFHQMCTLINPVGMGLRCSLDSALEIMFKPSQEK
jgi:hypothetical protein